MPGMAPDNSLLLLLRLFVLAGMFHIVGADPPHILVVVMDDLGSSDLGRHGSGIQTPVSDQLVKEGLELENFYVLPTCTTTRVALMTGRYPYRMGQYTVVRASGTDGMAEDEDTLPQVLSRAGYQTHGVGKWHLGHAKEELLPTFRGFQSYYGFYVSGSQDYYNHTRKGAYDMRWDQSEFCGENCSQVMDERGNYSTHIFGREATRVVNEYAPADGPLFLYLAFSAVHTPLQVPDEYFSLYDNSGWSAPRKTYAAMLSAADEALGNVTQALKDQGMWDDTVVVYMTDNGAAGKYCIFVGEEKICDDSVSML
jgi:arylsulfatase A-like enzyme